MVKMYYYMIKNNMITNINSIPSLCRDEVIKYITDHGYHVDLDDGILTKE